VDVAVSGDVIGRYEDRAQVIIERAGIGERLVATVEN
jgi:hypothetical protein